VRLKGDLKMLAPLRSVLRALRRRTVFENEMDEEMRFHIENRAADLERQGLPQAEAARRARIEFGSIEKQKDLARASVGVRMIDELGGDVRYALRTFARNKAFATTAIVTLALGIGANTAIFTLIDVLMLRTLPVSHPEQLLQLTLGSRSDQIGGPTLSYPMVLALDAERQTFAGVAGFSGFGCASGAGDMLRRVPCAVVTGSFYDTLGLMPAAGRLLSRDDDVAGAPLVAVASFDYWTREFAGSAAAIGQTMLINGVAVELVGVSPPGFSGANVGNPAELTLPVAAISRVTPNMAPLLGKGNSWLQVLARLRPDVSEAQAAARLSSNWRRIADASIDSSWPAFRQQDVSNAIIRFAPGATGWTYLRDLYVKPLRILMGGVSLLLLIACANVASLLLARASARRREFAVRMAIGAGRGRVMRQLFVESLTLALLGAAAGVWLALAGGRLLVELISTTGSPVVFDLSPNWRIIGFAIAVASATALFFGLAPALQCAAVDTTATLKEGARAGSARRHLLPSLVTLQIALSLVLLIGAGLFMRTLRNLELLDTGFKAQGVLFVEFERGPQRLPGSVLEAVRAIPGVLSASISTHTPLSGSRWSEAVVPAGEPLPERDNAVMVGAAPDFFHTLGIPLVAGREFTVNDTMQSPAVAIVNERYAARHFPHGHPVGQHLTALLGTRRDLEIVAVARNANTASLRGTPPATVYLPYAQITGDASSIVVVRAAGSFPEISAALRRTLQPLAPVTPLDVQSLSDQVGNTLTRERLMATLAGAFGLLALVLAAVGIYGLLAFAVAQRTREIGIRMALGAPPLRVVALVLRGAQVPLMIGIAAGLPAAWALSRVTQSMLFGLTPTDPLAIGVATLLLVVVAHLAAYVPARRAARVDPLVALKHE
jgi:predicted permease